MPRLAQVVARHNGRLAGLTSDGAMYEQARVSGAERWQPVPAEGLEDAGRLVNLAVTPDGLLVVTNSRGAVYRQEGTGVAGQPAHWRSVDLAGIAS